MLNSIEFGQPINLDTLNLDDLKEEDKYHFGGPEVVKLHEDKMLEKRKKERQFKRTQMEKKRFFAQAQPTHIDEKPMSREERRMQSIIKMINMQQIDEQNKKRKEAPPISEHNESKSSWRETDELSSNERSKLKESKSTQGPELLGAPLKKLSIQQEKKEKLAPFRSTPLEIDDGDILNNTHLNKNHSIVEGMSLLKYIHNYEADLGRSRHELSNQVVDRLIEREAQSLEHSQQEQGLNEEDKFSQNLMALCTKLNGIDLNQSLKVVLQQLKG